MIIAVAYYFYQRKKYKEEGELEAEAPEVQETAEEPAVEGPAEE